MARNVISPETVASLSVSQVRQIYNARLKSWSARAGYGADTRAYLQATDGTTWAEFRADWEHGKICVTAAELPEVYAVERAMEDYEAAWLASAIALPAQAAVGA